MIVAIVVSLLAMAIFFALWLGAVQSVNVALFLMLVVFTIDSVFIVQPTVQIGIQVYPGDLLVVVLFFAAVYRLIALNKIGNIHPAWWVIGIVQGIILVWGLAVYGTQAGVDYRAMFYTWAGAVYFATFDYKEILVRRILRVLFIMGVEVCVIAICRWIMSSLDYSFRLEMEELDPTGVAFLRVMQASQIMTLSLAMIAAFFTSVRSRTRLDQLIAVVGFGLIVLLMQHRSVWVASVIGFAMVMLALRKQQGSRGGSLIKVGFVVLVIALVVANVRGGITDSIESQAVAATSTEEGTFVGRVFGWQQLLESWSSSGSVVTYAVGFPFGYGYVRFDSDKSTDLIDYAPHNQYIQILVRGGLVGLIAFLWVIQRGLRDAWRRSADTRDKYSPLVLAMTAALVFYYIPYGVHFSHMLVWGLLLGLMKVERDERSVRKINRGAAPLSAPAITPRFQR